MDFDEARKRLVDKQLIARGIRDPKVLEAMLKVPRHLFVPAYLQEEAYTDYPLPIGHGQTISQPYIVALMTEELELQGEEKVLEVGTGSGYQAAILAEIARRVITIERLAALSRGSREVLKNYQNILLVTGDGSKGYEAEAPYDGIVVTAAASRIPPALIAQLAVGSHLIIPVGDLAFQSLLKVTKTQKGVATRHLTEVRFVPLIPDHPVP